MTAAQYDDCIAQLRKAGAANPAGRLYHAAFGSPDQVSVFDVWTSQATFEAFGQTLMPILHRMGIDPGQPAVMPVHNVIVPRAAKPAAKKAGKKAATKKRPAPKQGKGQARRGKRR